MAETWTYSISYYTLRVIMTRPLPHLLEYHCCVEVFKLWNADIHHDLCFCCNWIEWLLRWMLYTYYLQVLCSLPGWMTHLRTLLFVTVIRRLSFWRPWHTVTHVLWWHTVNISNWRMEKLYADVLKVVADPRVYCASGRGPLPDSCLHPPPQLPVSENDSQHKLFKKSQNGRHQQSAKEV